MDTFDRLGAEPWAHRGRRELRATGRTRRRSQDQDAPLLTPQESRAALRDSLQALADRRDGDARLPS